MSANTKKYLIYAAVFLAGVVTSAAVRKLPVLNKLPTVGN